MADRDEARRQQLFADLASTGSVEARNELVESYAPLAEFFANRYRNRSDDHEDLRQVAHLALVNAVDRFDPAQGAAFTTFAGRTIDGELKRYFRDKTWAVRVPRSLKEAALEVRNAADDFAVRNARSATVDDLMELTGFDLDLVLEALDAHSVQHAASIDHAITGDAGGAPVSAELGSTDDRLEQADLRVVVDTVLDQLSDRQREVVELRFFGELTQQQIADRLGISQMQVSRLLRSTLEILRGRLGR